MWAITPRSIGRSPREKSSMRRVTHLWLFVLLSFVVTTGIPAVPQATAGQGHPAKKTAANVQSDSNDDQADNNPGEKGPARSAYGVPDDPPEDELAPAASRTGRHEDLSCDSDFVQSNTRDQRATHHRPAGGSEETDRGRHGLEGNRRQGAHGPALGSIWVELCPQTQSVVEYEEVADERRRTTSRPKTHADTPSGLIGSIRISTGNATGFRRTCCSRERQPDIWM